MSSVKKLDIDRFDTTLLLDRYNSYVWLSKMKNNTPVSYDKWMSLSEEARKLFFQGQCITLEEHIIKTQKSTC